MSTGVAPLSWMRVLTAWTFEPVVLILVLVAATAYAAGVRRVRRGGIEWPVNRTVWFLSGLALWAICVSSFIGVYERILFTDRAAQAALLLMVVPLLLALGAPLTLLMEAVSPGRRERLRKVLKGRASRALMFPPVSTAILVAPPWLFYLTPWYELALRSGVLNVLFHVEFVVFGLLYFWPRLQLDPVGREYPISSRSS